MSLLTLTLAFILLNLTASSSMYILNKIGDRINPYLTPLSLLTQSVSIFPSLYLALVSTYILLTILTFHLTQTFLKLFKAFLCLPCRKLSLYLENLNTVYLHHSFPFNYLIYNKYIIFCSSVHSETILLFTK